jgi:D-alanyl-D-alanine dipeptidase
MPTREATYQQLENEMLTFVDVEGVPVNPNNEVMVAIKPTDTLHVRPIDPAMKVITGEEIYVRESVAEMLGQASLLLAERNGLQLEVFHGYQALSLQASRFNALLEEMTSEHPELSERELIIEANRFIAHPLVAGHPTGGAVDCRPLLDGDPVDMGTEPWDFSRDSYTFSPYIPHQAQQSRRTFRDGMIDAGAAPYNGEWWHFSYGDKEWAAYTGHAAAVYDQIEFQPTS